MRLLGPFDRFAAAVRARHRRRAAAVPPLDAVLLLVPHARDTAWHLHVAGTQVNVAPRIALTMAAKRAPWSAPVPTTPPLVTARLRHSTSTVRIQEALTLVRHTHTRGVRVEPGGAPMATMPSVPAPSSVPPSLTAPTPVVSLPANPPLVVARPAPPTSDPAPAALAALEPARTAHRHDGGPCVPTSAPNIDVERITDSVLSALDRRVIAHRERYGSI